MNVLTKFPPEDQAKRAPDAAKDQAILDALDALVRAQNAYRTGLHHAASAHVATAARKLIAGAMPEAA